MAESLLERSTRYIDGSVYEGPRTINPIDGSFHEIADGLAMVCGFSHIWTLDTGDGLVVCDTSLPGYASVAVEHLRRWRPTPVGTIIYTHGHVDHVSGAGTFLEDAEGRGRPAPEVYRTRRESELSLMARGLYRDASRTSEALSGRGQEPD